MLKRQLFQLLTRCDTNNNLLRCALCSNTGGTTTLSDGVLAEKKLQYYRNLNATKLSSVRPVGWDEALPFDAIPGPKALPIIANSWRFLLPKIGDYYGLDWLETQRKLRSQFGDIVSLKVLPGRPTTVNLFNVKDIETVYRSDGTWPIRYSLPSIAYYRQVTRRDIFEGSEGLAILQGEDWFKFRSAVNPILMNPKNVLQYVEKMDQVTDNLVDNIRHYSTLNAAGEMPEDFVNELCKWALESIAVVTMDRELGCLRRDAPKDSEASQLVQNALDLFDLIYKLDVLPSLWKIISTKNWRKFVQVANYLTETNMKYINQLIAEKRGSPNNAAESSALEKLVSLDRKIAIAMSLDMLVGGVDTTGKLLGATLYYLAKNPDKQSELRKECYQLLKTKNCPVTKDILPHASYTRAVIKETMRLAPIAVGNLRTTGKDIILGGYQIPKGSSVFCCHLPLCLMDEHFPRAAEFIPERWLSTTEGELSHKNTSPFVSLPYGYGPRSCIGKRLANLELETAVLKIVRNFELKWTHEDMTFSSKLLHGIASPLKITVKCLDA